MKKFWKFWAQEQVDITIDEMYDRPAKVKPVKQPKVSTPQQATANELGRRLKDKK